MKRYLEYIYDGKEGFTLAEVLITVGVIGVVAAMTIPTLMLDYQRKVWEARLKKSYSVTVNACERMLVEENVSASNETQLYALYANGTPAEKNEAIRKYFKILRDGYNHVPEEGQQSRGFLIALPDGADLYYSTVAATTQHGPELKFYVDVNGEKSHPNLAGRDVFEFSLDRNCSYTFTAAGASAAATDFNYVIENNWEIPADGTYPTPAPTEAPTTAPTEPPTT